ncbi:Wzy polymerase domain-containing protein [Acinetobacter indicus]|uniref:O-antigen ligase family protein n=1 Tax=Acinetobacter indicus TaxID=756892 RepID=UPI00209B8D94|nr:O-antigen ligase family protein [Acinetobacter indicus]MCO8102114.1 Wzy polymerase domain-containing protein [Acinetobacter indicus]
MKLIKKISLITSCFLYFISILNPAFYLPWSGFLSEYLTFLSLFFLLPVFFNDSISIPRYSLIFLVISIIPYIQYNLGLVVYFDTAMLSVFYLIAFWLAILVGFNSAERYYTSLIFFYWVILLCGLVSSIIAILQWLHFDLSPDFFMQVNSRPSANMAQPNHLSTFLILSLISCLYFYESKIINNKILVIFSIILLIAISLTQSRTAWVIFLFLCFYWLIAYKRHILTFDYKKNGLYLSFFIGISILLPLLKKLFFQQKTISIVERASSGYERIQIWLQALEAIKKQPFYGYGWNQSSFAQFDTIQEGFIKNRLSSFHNIILDIILWCGIPLAICLFFLFSYFIFKYLIKSYNFTQICAVSFIITIVIHALLEFPLNYSYFLLPVGFLLGYLFFSFKEKEIKIKGAIFIFVFLVGFFTSFYIFREYSQIPDNMVAAEQHEMNEIKDAIILPYKMNFFKSFQYRAEWISLYPCTKMDEKKLNELKYMIKTYMIYYDLLKFSELLEYNGYTEQSKQYLNKINYIYDKEYTISDLKCSSAQ